MKQLLFFLFIASFLGCSTPQKSLDNTFYCFSNAGNLLKSEGEKDWVQKLTDALPSWHEYQRKYGEV